MCVVGYDDSRRAVRVINSWGREWADQGYGWISYDLFDKAVDGDSKFCVEAVALLNAPNLVPQVKMGARGSEGTAWAISILGSPKAISQVESVEYLLPAGYEPAAVRCRDCGDPAAGGCFVLRSSDVRADQNSGQVEVWVQFHLQTTRRATYPRPILIAVGGDGGGPNRIDPQPRTDVVQPPRPSRRLPSPVVETGEKTAVPNVVGLDSALATLKLMAAGFKVNLRRAGNRAPAGAGAVSSQDPAAGTAAAKGTTVILSVP
jgi:hypothetical protein